MTQSVSAGAGVDAAAVAAAAGFLDMGDPMGLPALMNVLLVYQARASSASDNKWPELMVERFFAGFTIPLWTRSKLVG